MVSPEGSDAPFPRTSLNLSLSDLVLRLESEVGLFSHRRIDVGTELLLTHSPRPTDEGELLDLGCGYGPIALVLALRAPRARVWAIDVDDRALEMTRANVRRAGLPNVVVCTPRSIPHHLRFTAIYSNPPLRIGKPALRALLVHWLGRLMPDASAYLVIRRDAGAETVARWLSGVGFRTTRLVAKRGYRVLEIRTRRGDRESS